MTGRQKSERAELAEKARQQGFTGSRVVDGAVSVRCDQCEALVINQVPCHETGCPNQKKKS